MAEQLTFHGEVHAVAIRFVNGEMDFAQGRKEVKALLDPEYVRDWPQAAFDYAAQLLDEALGKIEEMGQ